MLTHHPHSEKKNRENETEKKSLRDNGLGRKGPGANERTKANSEAHRPSLHMPDTTQK